MMVYVDDMLAPYSNMKMSHMVADTPEELHAMATAIGVQRRHYQGDHYDVCQSKKRAALARGTVQVTMRELGAMVANRRVTGSLGDPSTAIFEFRTRRAIKRQAA